MCVETAMGQADIAHDVGYACTVVPASPGSTRGGPHDPFVGDFLAAGGNSPVGSSAHMMTIISRQARVSNAARMFTTQRMAELFTDIVGRRRLLWCVYDRAKSLLEF